MAHFSLRSNGFDAPPNRRFVSGVPEQCDIAVLLAQAMRRCCGSNHSNGALLRNEGAVILCGPGAVGSALLSDYAPRLGCVDQMLHVRLASPGSRRPNCRPGKCAAAAGVPVD